MKVRRYFASNMRNALEIIRQEQGPDALILSNRKVEGGVELITADEEVDAETVRTWSEQHKARPRPARVPDRAPVPAQAAAPEAKIPRAGAKTPGHVRYESGATLWTDDTVVAQMQSELKSMRGLLEQQLSGLAWSQFGTRHPLRARLLRALSKTGISPKLARDLVVQIPETVEFRDAWQQLLAVLTSRLAVLDDPVLKYGGRVALVGPTGVGKTTMTSKLATRFAVDKGTDSVAVISMDDNRLGAHQQLKAFGRVLGVTVSTARGVDELNHCLNNLADKELVLIDCPGLAPDDLRFRELIASLGRTTAAVHSYLVLAATTDYLALSKILAALGDLRLSGCMITKLDEAAVLGPAVSAVIEARLPVGYLSSGQQVPDDLEDAVAASLVRQTVMLANQTPVPEDPARLEQAFAL